MQSIKHKRLLITLLLLISMYLIGYKFVLQNPAQRAYEPIGNSLSSLHPTKLCTNSAGRFEPDTSPYYTVYEIVGSPTNLTQEIETIAAKYGYYLQTDDQYIALVQKGAAVTGEKYNPTTDYLTANNGKHKLRVEIVKNGTIPLNCSPGNPNYFKNQAPDSGKAILEIDLG